MRTSRRITSGLSGKKANFIIDSIYIVVLIFLVAVALVFSRPALKEVNNAAVGMSGTIKNTLGDNTDGGKAAIDNVTSTVQTMEDEQSNFFDWAFLIIFIILILLLWISVWYIDTNPVFFIVILILLVVCTLLAMALSNAFDDMIKNSGQAATINEFKIIPFILQNLPAISITIIIITGVLLYAKLKQN